jgi:uncharacterized protein (TIGR04255 family)
MLRQAVDALLQAYPSKIAPLGFAQVTLRYIDAVPLNQGSEMSVLSFLKDYLHTTVCIDERLFDDPKITENPVGLNLRFNYPLEKPLGVGVLSFATGMRENVPAVIWENIVISKDSHVPTSLNGFDSWFEEAHTIIDRWFFTLCRGRLLTSFGGDNAY